MKITYFFRHPDGGFSIAKVSQIFVDAFMRTDDVSKVTMPFHVNGFLAIFRNMLFAYRHREREGLNHITGDCHYIVLSLLGCKSVLTIHDTVSYDNQHGFFRRLFFKWFYFKFPLMLADRVVCISDNTRRSVQRFTKRKDLDVIPDAIDDSIFHPQPKSLPAELPHFLIVGTGWNKNVEREVRALENIPCVIDIVGPVSLSISRALEETGAKYRQFKNLSDVEIYNLYVQSDIVLFCSVYEGFGMPVLEAQATGRPVITSRIEPLKGVAGSGACYVDHPESVEEIRKAILKLLSDKDYYGDLVAKGLKNVTRFMPSVVVSEYARVYKSL